MTYENWADIYQRLKKRITKYASDPSRPLVEYSVDMHRSQIQMTIEFREDAAPLAVGLHLDADGIHPYLMCVKIKPLSRLDEYMSAVSKSTTRSSSHKQKSSSKLDKPSTTGHKTIETINEDEEYVPASQTVSSSTSQPVYTPSKPIVNPEQDEYTPSKITQSNSSKESAQSSLYDLFAKIDGPSTSAYKATPSKANNVSTRRKYDRLDDQPLHPRSPHSKRTRSNSHALLSPIKLTANKSSDLFGDVSDDDGNDDGNGTDDAFITKDEPLKSDAQPKRTDKFGELITKRNHLDRKVKSNEGGSSEKDSKNKQVTIAKWCSKAKSKENTLKLKDKGNNNHSDRNRKRNASNVQTVKSTTKSTTKDPYELTEEERQREQEQVMASLRELKENCDKIHPPVEPVDRELFVFLRNLYICSQAYCLTGFFLQIIDQY